MFGNPPPFLPGDLTDSGLSHGAKGAGIFCHAHCRGYVFSVAPLVCIV